MNTLQYTTSDIKKIIPIYIGFDILEKLPEHISKLNIDRLIIITDNNVKELWGEKLDEKLIGFERDFFVIPSGESSKNFGEFERLCNDILDKGITKKSLVIAFGGGVVGNISGLVSGTLFRGIKFVHIPTTVLAQADSTTGGKQAINSRHGKNTIGIFYEPEFIFIDHLFLKTLPEREIRCGIAECIKHALCQDELLLEKLENENFDIEALSDIIQKTIKLKLGVIEKDRKEINEGKILVYGHTIGHAIETLSGGKFNHGEAISIGMCCASNVANEMGILSDADKNRHYQILKAWHLPTKIPVDIGIDLIIEQLNFDKKIKDAKIEMILLEKVCSILKSKGKVGVPIKEDQLREILKLCY